MRSANDPASSSNILALLAALQSSNLLPGDRQGAPGGGGDSAYPRTDNNLAEIKAASDCLARTLLLRQQAEERVRIQNIALSASLASAVPPPSSTDNLALLLRQRNQIRELQAAHNLAVAAAAAHQGRNRNLQAFGGTGNALEARTSPKFHVLGAAHLVGTAAPVGGGLGNAPPTINLPASQAQHPHPPVVQSLLDNIAIGRLRQANDLLFPVENSPRVLDTSIMPLGTEPRRKGRTSTFPQKLHQMLTDLEKQEGGTEIASFVAQGRAFAIHKPEEFAKHIMPKYFRMSRFSSFQRQLNLYNFTRVNAGFDRGAYFHGSFQKSQPLMATMMRRTKIKGAPRKRAPKQATTRNESSDEDDEALLDTDDNTRNDIDPATKSSVAR